eukprot:12417663-Karenia_brevis.AAC.1
MATAVHNANAPRPAWRALHGARGTRGALMLMCIALHKNTPAHWIAIATAVHNADALPPARHARRAWR